MRSIFIDCNDQLDAVFARARELAESP